MQGALVLTKQELEEHDEKIANVVAQRVAEAIAKTGGVREPLPDIASANWIIKHKDIYDLSYGQLNDRHSTIIAEFGPKNPICHRCGKSVYYDRRKFEAWLLGKRLKKQQDPRMAMLGGA